MNSSPFSFVRENTVMSEKKIAVVTGASSGLGRAMARKFKKEGFYVVAVSRKAPEDGVCDRHIAADLTDKESLEAAAQEILKLEKVEVFINNAGLGAYAKWDELREEELRRLMELDFFAPVLLTTKVLPVLRAGRCCVVNISSAAGLLPVACMGAYSAAKAALRMFSDTLKIEERDLHVVTVFPGRISTGFGSRACGCREVPNTPSHGSETPEALAERVYKACCKKKRKVIYPYWYRFVISTMLKFSSIYEKGSRKVWKI